MLYIRIRGEVMSKKVKSFLMCTALCLIVIAVLIVLTYSAVIFNQQQSNYSMRRLLIINTKTDKVIADKIDYFSYFTRNNSRSIYITFADGTKDLIHANNDIYYSIEELGGE
ncbi:MAG: hypothetical protein GYA87_09400 [Christensenellaceae bacterium]|nr:hypothetical protein [Christensenellaceae bacterium]